MNKATPILTKFEIARKLTMEDLDNLLEDIPEDASKKSKAAGKAKKAANDDDWGDLDFDEPKPVKRAGTSLPRAQ